jgi:hypothetical protein
MLVSTVKKKNITRSPSANQALSGIKGISRVGDGLPPVESIVTYIRYTVLSAILGGLRFSTHYCTT